MADEPRRSGRATKGQYNKDRDIPEDAPPKRRGKAKTAKAQAVEEEEEEEEEENAIIRCICGLYEEEEDEERTMICCDKCDAWQHNDCMGLNTSPDWAPDKYYCEQCAPQDHKELLAAVVRGEKPWEQRAAAAIGKKKKGKRGRKSGAGARVSDVRVNDAQPEDTNKVESIPKESIPKQSIPKESPAISGQKRKHEEPSPNPPQDTKKPRQTPTQTVTPQAPKNTAKTAAPALPKRTSSSVVTPIRQGSRSEPTQAEKVHDPSELHNTMRNSTAKALINLFVDQANAARKAGTYNPPANTTTAEAGKHIGLSVEHALYQRLSGGAGDPNQDYKEQLRTILHNVKKNPSLRDRVLRNDILPEALAVLPAAEMASKEQKERDEQIKKEAERQHIFTEDQGPRIRRTHKGDEFVDEEQQVAAESLNPVRRQSAIVDEELGERKSPDPVPDESGRKPVSPTQRQKLSRINTQAPPRPSTVPERKSSSNFNIQNVWSSVQGSPDADRPQFAPPRRLSTQQSPTGPGAQADAEIDALLKDEGGDEAPESPPYSPKDLPEDPQTLWRGVIDMTPVARFKTSAKLAGGADPALVPGLTFQFQWNMMLPKTITVDGRIKAKTADEYLCGLRFSHTTDVTIMLIKPPPGEEDQIAFNALFDYFKSRDRFGVGANHPNKAVKDMYFIPIESGKVPEKEAEFLQLLGNNFLAEATTERIFLLAVAAKLRELDGNAAQAISPGNFPQESIHQVSASPVVHNGTPRVGPSASPPQQHSTAFASTLHADGTVDGSVANHNQSPLPINGQITPAGRDQNSPQVSGVAAAAQILGPHKDAPAVLELLQQVPHAGISEMQVIKAVIEENPEAARNMSILYNMLLQRQGAAASSAGTT
ncbi:MAG: hypothetical protein Q9160_007614 [Pyrenula sp. 1 TL-2023]